MESVKLDNDGFPVLPDFRATWCPLYLEPIANSGERITFAIVVTSHEGVRIQSVLRPSAVRALYGAKAAGIRGITELSVDSLKAHIEKGRSASSWRSPITGIHIGKWRDALATSIDLVLSQAIQQTASLSSLELAGLSSSKDAERAHEGIRGRWIDAVRDEVAKRNIQLVPYFEKEGTLVDKGQPVRFGFLGREVIAHFGLLRPRRLAESYKDARGRLWELRKARDRAEFRRAGLILYLPHADDPNLEPSEFEGAIAAFDELKLEGTDDKVTVHPVHSTPEAAEELIKIAA